jgi:hypothetical protein
MCPRSATTATITSFIVTLVRPTLLQGQVTVSHLFDSARTYIEELAIDSATSLLRQALRPELKATDAERVRGYTLLGIAILPEAPSQAREAFHRALVLDPDVRVDSLADLASGLIAVFEAERAKLLLLHLQTPADTLVPVQTGRLQLTARTSHRANVILSVMKGDTIVRRDSFRVSGTSVLEWDMRSRDGAVISPGEYLLRVDAQDSTGETASAFERRLTIAVGVGDTQPAPPALDSSAFEPESVTVLSHRQPKALARGLVLGTAAGLLSSLAPGGRGKTDAKSIVVAGAVSLAGLIGFFTEGRVIRPVPANIQHNRQVRLQDAQKREAIARANAQARSMPPLRIVIHGTGP